jgi:hypothetical protein
VPSDYEPFSLGKYVRGIITGEWRGAERRAMSEGSGGAGQYLVPSARGWHHRQSNECECAVQGRRSHYSDGQPNSEDGTTG